MSYSLRALERLQFASAADDPRSNPVERATDYTSVATAQPTDVLTSIAVARTVRALAPTRMTCCWRDSSCRRQSVLWYKVRSYPAGLLARGSPTKDALHLLVWARACVRQSCTILLVAAAGLGR